jgi:HEAT repeat protein
MPVASIALNTFWRANDLDGTLGMTRDGFCHSAEQVKQLHRDGKAVVANFSDSSEEMDLDAMKSAVAAGVDAINVDYPRLGAEAVGRPVEVTVAALTKQATIGDASSRCRAILQLGRYRGLPLRDRFARWLEDPQPQVNRAAALALLQPAYKAAASNFASATNASSASVRANAAWALGRLRSADALALVLPLTTDRDSRVRAEAYLALSELPGEVSGATLYRGLADAAPAARGAAAAALAHHPSEHAAAAIEAQLLREMEAERELYIAYTARKPTMLTPAEIASVTASFRCQMQMIKALASFRGTAVTSALARQAFRPGSDFSQMNAVVAALNLWDRIGSDPQPAIEALASSEPGVADRAEWMLLHAGPEALPAVRAALHNPQARVQLRVMRILSFAGNSESIPLLRSMQDGPLSVQAREAIDRIEALQRN